MTYASKRIDELVERLGETITGQVNVTWFVRQTAEQYVEIKRDGGDSEEFTDEDFFEYVTSNVSDFIANTLESYGQVGLEKEILLVCDSGEELN